ncbi:MAG TPA: hypothetical protein DEB60_09740 [Brevundimonas sp.]|nr:hypothetical protein [Brevundimonas sp.]
MTDVQPNDPNRDDETGLDGDEVEAGRAARKAAANQDSGQTSNPADRSATPATGGAGAAGAGGPKGFGTGT